jgi:hypothetical protein
MPMVTCIQVNGKMAKETVKENILMQMDAYIMVNLKMDFQTEEVICAVALRTL